MNKTILFSAMLLTMATASPTASAALANGVVLNFDAGVTDGSYGTVSSGSYFGMDTNGDGIVKVYERVAMASSDGLIIGSAQAASGTHMGAPGCVNDGGVTCNNTGENPGIDAAWSFSGNTGMHSTNSASNILASTANTADIDFSGWFVNWNGGPIDMSGIAWEGNANGIANVTCGVDCAVGDSFTLTYSATVPASDPGFGGVRYNLNLVGTVGASAVPVPAAVWLFGSGLVGLAGVARSRKTA